MLYLLNYRLWGWVEGGFLKMFITCFKVFKIFFELTLLDFKENTFIKMGKYFLSVKGLSKVLTILV